MQRKTMINFINKTESKLPHTQSLVITYPRTVHITFGNYPFPVDMHNMIIEIKQKISKENSYSTNVKAGMTDWQDFVDHKFTKNFFNFCINKHLFSNPYLFKSFYEKYEIHEAWGNEVKKGDCVNEHVHPDYHAILYLTKGSPLLLRELNLKISPEPGDYYFFPPNILHHVEKSSEEHHRYNLVFNIKSKNGFIKKC